MGLGCELGLGSRLGTGSRLGLGFCLKRGSGLELGFTKALEQVANPILTERKTPPPGLRSLDTKGAMGMPSSHMPPMISPPRSLSDHWPNLIVFGRYPQVGIGEGEYDKVSNN